MRACESCRTLHGLASTCPSLSCPHLPAAYVAVCCVGRCHAVAPCRVVSCRAHEEQHELSEERKKEKEETWELTWTGAPDWRSELVEVSLAWR